MKDENSIREGISDIILKLLMDKKLQKVMSKIENDPETHAAVKRLKDASDQVKPAVKNHIKKYPNSSLTKLLKKKGLS